ncbi:hypothetical protein [Thermococcus sp. JCM 11816]|uniref:hypothetical protein n=1 Tax=Thermococcus sp. (strain JCM 11816 / KS-1) TaxID=1295125 RepID=UPI000A4E70A4
MNGKQYELHYFMSDKAMMDFYYLIRVGRKYYLWNVRKAPVEFKWLGDRARGTYDYYALVHKDYVAELDEDELILFLAENVFG